MAYIDYDNCYSIYKNYEIFHYNYISKNKKNISCVNLIGTEYIKLINNLSNIYNIVNKTYSSFFNYFCSLKRADELSNSKFYNINKILYKEFSKLGLNGFIAELYIKDIHNRFKNYLANRTFLEESYNEIKELIDEINSLIKNISKNEKETNNFMKNHFLEYNKYSTKDEKIKRLEEYKNERTYALEHAKLLVQDEDDHLKDSIFAIYFDSFIDVKNSMKFFYGKELEMHINNNTITSLSLEHLDSEILRTSNFIEIPRSQMNYEIVKENKIIIEEDLEKIRKSNNKELVTSYDITSLKDFCCVNIKYFMDNNIKIHKCNNCGKYFKPTNRSDEVYCNNPSPQNPNKTCKEYGAKKTYRDEIKSTPIKYEHNKTSQFFRMRINRTSTDNIKEKEMYQKKFNTYKENYQKKKEQYKSGKLKEKDFVEWIIKQKEGVRNGSTRNSKK